MKRWISSLAAIALALTISAPALAQGVAVSVRNGTTDPAQCQPTSLNVFLNRTGSALKLCTAANTWSSVMMSSNAVQTWVNSAAGDWNPTSNNAYSIGNGAANPKDINLTRNLNFFNAAQTVVLGQWSLGTTGDLTYVANTLTSSAPSAALAGAGAGNVDNGTHVYAETCVTAGGQTNVSASSGAVTVADKTADGQVTVTLATATPCGPFTTGRNLYRSKSGTTAPLFLVAASPVVADNSTATYTDNLADASLQAGTAPTLNTASDTRTAILNTGLVAQRTPATALVVGSNTIAPKSVIQHVGAGLIKTITVPANFTAGCIYLVPDAAFTTDATGNVSKSSTAVTGQVMAVCYDGTKWNPSY